MRNVTTASPPGASATGTERAASGSSVEPVVPDRPAPFRAAGAS